MPRLGTGGRGQGEVSAPASPRRERRCRRGQVWRPRFEGGLVEHHVGWAVDPGSSRVDFMLRHLDAASLDTGSAAPGGQEHVARLFGSDEHPAIQLRTTWARPIAHGRYQLDALLTMHGETHYVELTADPGELDTDRAGRRIYVARAEGTIDRRQWGVSVHPLLEAGGFVLGH